MRRSGLPKQPRRFIFEAKANQILFDYIRKNKFYESSTRMTAQMATYDAVRNNGMGGVAPCPTSGPTIICFPPGVGPTSQPSGTANEGTILVKGTWRQLTMAEYSSGRYLTAPIIRYRDSDPLPYCYETIDATPTANTLPYGLVGLHIIHKTTNYPTYVFATFEQVDNLNSAKPDNSLFYYNRNSAPPINPNKQTVTSRAHPIPSEIDAVTNTVHLNLRQLLADATPPVSDSVWLYYKLVGVQGTAVNATDPSKTDYFLANIVTETNEALRSFSGTLNTDNGTINPQNTNLRVGTTALTGGGCKGCHGNAQVGPTIEAGAPFIASDFSFITQGAPFEGVPDAINQPILK